jgi:hypothetical protein
MLDAIIISNMRNHTYNRATIATVPEFNIVTVLEFDLSTATVPETSSRLLCKPMKTNFEKHSAKTIYNLLIDSCALISTYRYYQGAISCT